MSKTQAITAKDAVRELWHRVILTYKLHAVQKQMTASYISQNKEITVIASSRRLGKSFWLCVLAVEQCLKVPNSIVKYVCPKKNMVKTILQPIMTEICKDAPAELKPEFRSNAYIYEFPNGSQIQMAGTDNGHHETLRGSKSELWIVDEAGFCDELTYVVNTILAPTADTTGGRGIIASTPSKTSDHEFISDFYYPAELDGSLIKYTVYDNPLLSKADVVKIINRYPLKEKDPEFMREYLCLVVNNGDRSIVPEFTPELQEKIVKEVQRPPFFDCYVGMDIGGKDYTVVLFGYYDFMQARLVVEDELVFGKKGNSRRGNEDTGFILLPEFRIDDFVKYVNKKEEELWKHPLSGEIKKPYLRIADNNNVIFLNDLLYKHNLQFLPTRKDNRDAAINNMRQMLAEERIIIHPRCKTLIQHLKVGIWAKNKKDFERSAANGHFDAIPALYYLVRNLDEKRNPYPPGYQRDNTHSYYTPQAGKQFTPAQQTWVDLFKSRKSRT
jgi:hypothetical protein